MRIFTLGMSLLLLAGCTGSKPKTPAEQLSYTIGAQFGKSIKAQNVQVEMKYVQMGIEDALKKDKLVLTDEEMRAAIMGMSEKRQKDMAEAAKGNKAKAEEYLAKNKTADGVKTTASGLQYKMLKEGEGKSPSVEDTVSVHYKGTLADGTEFDSSFKNNQPAEFPLKGIIPGWTEGLLLMKKGGKAMFYIPPELGYGERQRQMIPPNSVLIFEVELLDIKGKGKAPAPKK